MESSYVFWGCPNLRNLFIYVPSNSIDAYKTAKVWSKFGTILPLPSGDPSGIDNVKAQQEIKKDYYNLRGIRSFNKQKGIIIIKMSDGTTKKVVVK